MKNAPLLAIALVAVARDTSECQGLPFQLDFRHCNCCKQFASGVRALCTEAWETKTTHVKYPSVMKQLANTIETRPEVYDCLLLELYETNRK